MVLVDDIDVVVQRVRTSAHSFSLTPLTKLSSAQSLAPLPFLPTHSPSLTHSPTHPRTHAPHSLAHPHSRPVDVHSTKQVTACRRGGLVNPRQSVTQETTACFHVAVGYIHSSVCRIRSSVLSVAHIDDDGGRCRGGCGGCCSQDGI